MGEVVFVEILDRLGHVKDRVRLESFPATIGRAYTNDVIVDDRHVCPLHLRLVKDAQGRLIAEDAGSVNGLFTVSPARKVERLVVSPDTRVRIGTTVLQFRTPDSRVAPALRDRGVRGFPGSAAASAALFVLSICFMLFSNAIESYEPFTPSGLLAEALTLVLIFAVWAGIWSFVNRLVSHAFRFLAHLASAGLLVSAVVLFNLATEYADFLLSPQPLVLTVVRFGGFALLGAALLFVHLSMVGALAAGFRVLAAFLVSSAIFGVVGYKVHDDHAGFSNIPVFSAEIKPVHASRRTLTAAEFVDRARVLKARLDEEAREAPDDAGREEGKKSPGREAPAR